MKRLQALIAAAITTALIGFGVLVIGANAASNPYTVPISNSPVEASTVSTGTTSAQVQAQLDQLQNLISQYQDREKQYQAELNTLSQKLSDANLQVDQLQQILVELQQRGVIRITRDGRIQLPQG